MAHFTHFRELETDIVRKAIKRILNTGAVIRTQSPVIKHINDDPIIWERMLKEQVQLGCVPYYMFIARNTGAHNFFNVPLVKAWQIFRNAYKNISGTARTIRGPCYVLHLW
jgi:L-lysine 2,3-aminomutase